jgi:hypothetical protein
VIISGDGRNPSMFGLKVSFLGRGKAAGGLLSVGGICDPLWINNVIGLLMSPDPLKTFQKPLETSETKLLYHDNLSSTLIYIIYRVLHAQYSEKNNLVLR